ncbi:MAG: hypothetical protein WCG07_02355 [Candidatus Taylorbacteria bacterium]
MVEIEIERTYLAKSLPKILESFPSKEIIDVYIPENVVHPVLRIRKKGTVCEITKKQPMRDGDSSEQEEHTIRLDVEEFESLRTVKGKKIRKIRYDYVYDGLKAEIDVFQDELKGLVLVDFEFVQANSKDAHVLPEFCLVDVTQDEVFAGGMLCGKKYADIEDHLKNLGYQSL